MAGDDAALRKHTSLRMSKSTRCDDSIQFYLPLSRDVFDKPEVAR
jgi:hypothetical protein